MTATKPSRWPPERCSVLADRRHDPMLGTAFPAGRLLLVEQPFPWDSEGLRTSRFDRRVALELEARAREELVRVQAIRRPGGIRPEGARQWAIVDTRDQAGTVHRGEYGDDAELLDLPLDGSTGDHDAAPLYLVCTHGKHDPCCGRRGRPLVAALAEARPGQVWQASHLGGCRFAPTVLVLPLGLMYGRVPVEAVDELLTATEEGGVLRPYLRGRVGVPPATQAALGFAHEQLDLPAVRDLSPVATAPIDDSTVAVRVDSPRGAFDVTVERRRIDAVELTCAHPGASWFLAHRGVAIEPAAPGQEPAGDSGR